MTFRCTIWGPRPTDRFMALTVAVLFSFASAARAQQDPNACDWSDSRIDAVNPEDPQAPKIFGVAAGNLAQLRDGFQAYGQAGLTFDARVNARDPLGAEPRIRPWDGRPDILAGTRRLFVPFFGGEFQNEKLDAGADGGFLRVLRPNAQGGVDCPADKRSYGYHWMPKEGEIFPNDVYCVRSRDGRNYALLMVEALCPQGIRFRYRYNGPNHAFAAPAATPAPALR